MCRETITFHISDYPWVTSKRYYLPVKVVWSDFPLVCLLFVCNLFVDICSSYFQQAKALCNKVINNYVLCTVLCQYVNDTRRQIQTALRWIFMKKVSLRNLFRKKNCGATFHLIFSARFFMSHPIKFWFCFNGRTLLTKDYY